jgi:hypothetical protein
VVELRRRHEPRFWQEGPMAKILYATSFGSDDPTRATIPFIAATGAIQAGHEPEIALLGEATYLVKTGMAEQIQGVGFPPLQELFAKLIEHRVSRLRVRAVREGPWGLRGRTQQHRCTVHQPSRIRAGDGRRRPGSDRLNADAASLLQVAAARLAAKGIPTPSSLWPTSAGSSPGCPTARMGA